MKSVAIVAFASRSVRGFDSSQWDEVWGLNDGKSWPSPDGVWHRWFDMHVAEYLRTLPRHKWLAEQGGSRPIYTLTKMDEISGSVEFPYQRVDSWLRSKGCDTEYYTSSFSYMVGLALAEGFEKIGLYGVDLVESYEMYFERAGLEYLVGLARGLGREVVIPPESPLLRIAYRYSYDEPCMSLSLVKPFMEFLDAEIAYSEKQEDRLWASWDGEWKAAEESDERTTLANACVKILERTQTLRTIRTWYGLYGHKGTLLAPGWRLQE